MLVAALAAGTGAAAPTGPPPARSEGRSQSLDLIALENRVRSTLDKATPRGKINCDLARKDLAPAYRNPDFNNLSVDTRSKALQLGIICSTDIGGEETLDLARRLDPIAPDALARAVASYPIMAAVVGEDDKAAAQRMIVVIDGLPVLVQDWRAAWVWPMVRAVEDDETLSLALLSRLITVDWQDKTAKASASGWRLKLATRQAEMKNYSAVRDTVEPLDDLETLLAVAVDRRFEPVWAEMQEAERFDWLALIRSELALHRREMEADPKSLSAIVLVADDLRALGRYEEAIGLLQGARARLGETGAFEDRDRYANWLLNNLAYALNEAGRPAEADVVWKEAVAEGAAQGDKISQYVNYAGFLNRNGRSAEAVALLESADRETASPIGKAFQESGLICALARTDPVRANRMMDALLAHWEDHPPAVSGALICMDRLDAAADIMVRRLASTKHRSEALRAAVITLPDATDTDWDRTLAVRREAVLARPEVARALDAAGRRLTLPIHRVYWGNE